jgi:hypothetical protein
LSLSKYEDNSDPIPRPAVVLAAFSKALAELLLDSEGVEEVPVPKPTDELEAPPPSDAKNLTRSYFLLTRRGLLCRLLQSHYTKLNIILVKYGCKLISYLSEVNNKYQ